MKPTVTVVSLADDKSSGDNDEPGGPKKRGRPSTSRVPGGAQSTKRTCRSPAMRTRKTINDISKAAGHGAKRLVSTTAQGVYHRPFSGLRVPQGSVGALEPEQPSWVVGREVVETRRDTGSAGPQQIVLQENAEDEEELHEVPGHLTERERLMLQMTQAEKEHGAVRVIKCKLCPDARPFGTWVTFVRHCKSCEEHPSELEYCPTCGDYFGRTDSIDRHKKKRYQAACLGTKQYEAEEKKKRFERHLNAFNERLTDRLKNGKEFKSSFSKVMTKKLSNTSKKISKTDIPLEDDSWAEGL
jgi:hypothetical protein